MTVHVQYAEMRNKLNLARLVFEVHFSPFSREDFGSDMIVRVKAMEDYQGRTLKGTADKKHILQSGSVPE